MSQTTLRFDDAFVYSALPQHFCITDQTKQATAEAIKTAVTSVENQIASGKYGFIEVLKDNSYLDQVYQVLDKISWAKTLVVVGIGGSDLGARAIQVALEQSPLMKVLFHGDSTDPVQIQRLLEKIDLSQTVFNIVSKSGQTVETISQYVFLKAKVQAVTPDWQKHFVFTTDQKEGVLKIEADKHTILTLPIPDSVGGRFSVLTPVGLFPAAAMGADLKQMIGGALDFAQNPTTRLMASQFATSQYQLYTQGMKLTVIMPYAVQLEEFARWFRQLWGESLGKNNQGILPIQARGPADQHSQIQFYSQGVPMESILFVRLENYSQDFTIDQVDVADVEYLNGHSFQEIIQIEQEATALSLKKLGRPTTLLSVEKLTEYSLGELFMFFELAVVYLAEMLGVNAFDQPGVEEGKQMIYAMLGRQGFEEKLAEIEQLRSH